MFLSRTLYFFSKLPSATYQQLFCVTETDIGRDLQTMNYWFQYCDLHGALVKFQRPAKQCTKHLWTCSTVNKLASDKKSFFFNFIFPALIDNQNNFEISRLIRLAVSGMFLLPYSASLMSFSSFCSYFQETLRKVDTFLKWTPSTANTLFWSRRCSL